MTPCALAPVPVQQPGASSRPPHAASTPGAAGRLCAIRARPMGVRPTAEGARRSAVRRRRRRACARHTCGPSPTTRHASGGWNRPGTRRSPPGRLAPGVEALQALRGVPCTGAVTLGAARGARPRVETPRQRMQYRGLPPSASARGARRRQGGLTTTGHLQARRALLEGAWASRDPAHVSRPRPRRRAHLPQGLQDLRWKAPGRWCPRCRPRGARGTHAHHVVVVIARARAAFLWAIAPQGSVTPDAGPTCGVVEIRTRLAVHRHRRRPGRGSSSTA